MKRFWQVAAAAPQGDAYAVELDGKPVRLPGGAPLQVQTLALAEAIAAEWQGAAEAFGLDDLPLTRLAGTAQERVAGHAGSIAEALAAYAGSDLLCYRAATPPELAALETAKWHPWLDWAAQRYGVRLKVTVGVVHVPQDSAALAALAVALAAQDVASLAGLGILVPVLGSVVLSLAVVEGALDPREAFALSVLDETFQAAQWGDDADAVARRAAQTAEVEMAARFIALSRQPGAG